MICNISDLQNPAMVAQEFTVDLNKPLVFQVGHLGDTYQDWVHQPIASKEGPRFFESDFWEILTLTVWWVIPLVWLPVVCFCVSKSIRMGHTVPEVALMVVFGIFVWTLLEYTLHRFLFHIKTKSYWGNTMHYLLHGFHHKHPMDGLRLVFPPAATAILCVPVCVHTIIPFFITWNSSSCSVCIVGSDLEFESLQWLELPHLGFLLLLMDEALVSQFWNIIALMATPSTTPALFGGGLLGYVMYDVTHYYLHHGQPTSEVPKGLKKYHLNHHFRIQNKGFGITSALWDRVFGTLPPSMSAKKSSDLQNPAMVAPEFTVDLNKPLVFQVGHLGDTYQEWVHQPIASKEGPRFFESDFWEILTLTVWWVIPLVWLPVVCFCVSKSIRMGHTVPEVALMVVFGIFVWTLLEYTLHRFLFHIKTKSYWGNTMHYLLHGFHHKHPMDGLRLVFPPAATAILCVLVSEALLSQFWNILALMATPSTTPALFGGGLLGYVMYDLTHYYLHHGQPTSEVPKLLKKYHLNHHFRIQNKGFGITSALWDRVFGTLPPSMSAMKSR
nr:dihydroceramide fatty acyl 2-hydroxylase FAH1-like [Ipomoea batatas]